MTKERDLISPGIVAPGGVWADFGSGTGIFTRELYGLLGPTCELYSIDRNARDLEQQRRSFAQAFPTANVHFLHANFTQPMQLPPLDGIVMANALHYVPYAQQPDVLTSIVGYLRRPGGRLILVEYNAEVGNPWVPYPISSEAFTRLAAKVGLAVPAVLHTVPSRFLREMYAALALRE
ncbi:MAG TPA: class I SAM-dependent methyltransferase [Ktedonobacterales bacterium]